MNSPAGVIGEGDIETNNQIESLPMADDSSVSSSGSYEDETKVSSTTRTCTSVDDGTDQSKELISDIENQQLSSTELPDDGS